MKTNDFAKKIKKFLKTDLGFVLLVFVIWRILLFAIGWKANVYFDYVSLPHSFNDKHFWDIWSNWDGGHYIAIAREGYFSDAVRTVFFPLLPMLMKIISKLTTINQVFAGLLINSGALIMAGFWLIKLVKLDYNERIARNSFILLLLFPTAVFLGSIYTESLFLMTTIGALYFARQKNWWAVVILGFMAGLTRNLGAFLVFPLLYEYFKQYKFKIRWPILAVGASGFGIVSYMAYLWALFGEPLMFVKQQVHWGRKIVVDVFWRFNQAWIEAINSVDPIRMIEYVSVSFALILIILMFWKKIRPSYIIWSIIILLIPVMQIHWLSMNRFVLVIFPIYIILSIYGDKYKYFNYLLYILFATGLFYHTALFVNLGWAG